MWVANSVINVGRCRWVFCGLVLGPPPPFRRRRAAARLSGSFGRNLRVVLASLPFRSGPPPGCASAGDPFRNPSNPPKNVSEVGGVSGVRVLWGGVSRVTFSRQHHTGVQALHRRLARFIWTARRLVRACVYLIPRVAGIKTTCENFAPHDSSSSSRDVSWSDRTTNQEFQRHSLKSIKEIREFLTTGKKV